MNLSTDTKMVVAGGLVAVVALWYLSHKAGQLFDAAGDVANNVITAVNPVSDRNIFYLGVNAIPRAVTGQDDWTLGGWIYDVTHPADSTGGASGSF